MARTAADVMIERLIDWGVDTVFGLPGDGVDGIVEALRTHQQDIRFILVRHEEAAAFMACAYAKYTGRLGVCLGTSGPGGIHLLNGLYDAKMDEQPVLALTGMQYHDVVNTFSQQDVEMDKLFENVALYDTRINGPSHVDDTIDLACRIALSNRTVSHITIPTDYQTAEAGAMRSKRNPPRRFTDVFSLSAEVPTSGDVQRAAEILNAGKKVAILAGQGALRATDELEQTADILAAPIVKALLGKGCVPDDSPYTTGGNGLLGTRPSQDAMEGCDTLLIVGSSFPYVEYYPRPGQARAVQIDINPQRIGLRYPVEVGLVGDSRRALQALLPLLRRKEDRTFLQRAQTGMRDWWQLMAEQGSRRDKPMKPQVVAWELNKRLENDAIVSSDSGTIATWWARQIVAKRGQMYSLSGNLATMANGFPYAIGAQVAYPNRQCVAFVGDGGFEMLMAEFSTCVKYNLPVKVVIVKNNVLGQIRWEQMVFLGKPEYGVRLHPIDFAAYARACGGSGYTIDDPAKCGDILDLALNDPNPTLIEAVVDEFEPPMPPRVTPEQAARFAEAMLRGEPYRGQIALTVAADQVRHLV